MLREYFRKRKRVRLQRTIERKEAQIERLERVARSEPTSRYDGPVGSNRFSSEYEIAEELDRAWRDAVDEKKQAHAKARTLKWQVVDLKQQIQELTAE